MSKEYNIFTLQNALITKNLKRSFLIAKKLNEKGENINLIVSILFSYFKKAMIAAKLKNGGKDLLAVYRELKINNYQQKDISATLKSFTMPKLEDVINTFHHLDRKIKSTGESDWALLQSLCYDICKK
jgi:DNA polymerase-3 subunit delta